jgi:hypothetical protein
MKIMFFINVPYSFIFKIKFYGLKGFISFLPSKVIFLSNFGFSHKNSTDTKTITRASGFIMNEKTGQLLNDLIITHDLPPSTKTVLLA